MAPLISLPRRCRPAPLPRAGFLRRCWPLARGPPMRVVFGDVTVTTVSRTIPGPFEGRLSAPLRLARR
jgi:hypothetical protein